MKSIFLFALLFFMILVLQAKDTIRITHTNYTAVFDKTLKYPVLVEWWDIRDKIKSVSVPAKCWKVIHVLKTGEWHSFVMHNEKEIQTGIISHEVSKKEVEQLSGF